MKTRLRDRLCIYLHIKLFAYTHMNPTLSVGSLPDSQERVLVKAKKGVLVRLPVPTVTPDLPLPFPGHPSIPLLPLVPLPHSTFISLSYLQPFSQPCSEFCGFCLPLTFVLGEGHIEDGRGQEGWAWRNKGKPKDHLSCLLWHR